MNNNENLNNVNNNFMGNDSVNNSVAGSAPMPNNSEVNTTSQTNLNNAEVNSAPTANPATSDFMNNNINSTDSIQNNTGSSETLANNDALTPNENLTVSPSPVQPSVSSQPEVSAPQNLGSQNVNPNENLAMPQASVQPSIVQQQETAMPQNLNNQQINPSVNNVPNQNLNPQQPVVNNVNKGNNKKLLIILVASISVALIAIIVAVVVISKNKSTTVNDYENSGTVSQTTDTMEFDGFTINKKAGYTYEIDEEVNGLLIASSTSAFQITFLPYSFNTVESNKESCRTYLSSLNYNPTNMKVSEYSGKKVLSFDLNYQDMKMLYFIYPISLENTSVEIYALSRTSNIIDYNLITESFELTKDIKRTSSSFVQETTDGNLKVTKTSSKLFEK